MSTEGEKGGSAVRWEVNDHRVKWSEFRASCLRSCVQVWNHVGAIGANCICQREIRKSSVLISAKPPDQVSQCEWNASSSVVARCVQACELCLCICSFCGILRKTASSNWGFCDCECKAKFLHLKTSVNQGALARAHAGKWTAVIKIAEIFQTKCSWSIVSWQLHSETRRDRIGPNELFGTRCQGCRGRSGAAFNFPTTDTQTASWNTRKARRVWMCKEAATYSTLCLFSLAPNYTLACVRHASFFVLFCFFHR